MRRSVYLDNAATTPVSPEVLEAMRPYFTQKYGNPSGVYELSSESRRALDASRQTIASTLNTAPENIYFTAGGTESDNWALIAAAEAAAAGSHIITTKIEHHAVLNTCRYLEKRGINVTYLEVDSRGFINLQALERAVTPKTILISVMAANNEIGTIEPLKAIGAIAAKYGVLFHTDAVQAYGHLPIDVKACGIDMLSASAHKLNGPKGVGFLYMKENLPIKPFIHGGGQERGKRAGTENVASIAGFGCAARRACDTMKVKAEKESALRDRLIYRICSELPYVKLNGDKKCRLPNNASFCFAGTDSTSMLILLDMAGISASGGSACSTGSGKASHVLQAIGCTPDEAAGALRLTLSSENTAEEIDYTVFHVKRIVNYLRKAGG